MTVDHRLKDIILSLDKKRIFLVFCLLVLPAVFAPYHSDDYFQLLLLSDTPAISRGGDGSLWGLFSFIDDVPAHRQQMLDYGVLPWFAADDFYFRFWRPLAEITHWLDYQSFGLAPLPAHVHSILWFLLLCALVYQLAQHLLPEKKILPLLALAIFAWDGQHVATIGWIANRNGLLAAVFSVLLLYAHLCWRETDRKRYLLLALLSLLLALASGEAALAIGSYLFCYACLLDGRGWKKGLMALSPYAVMVAVWFYYYQLLGFGVNTSAGLYLNPVTEPLEYIAAIIYRLPVYSMASVLPIPAGLSWGGGAEYAWIGHLFFVVALLVLALFFLLFRKMISGNRLLAFCLLSSLLALLPVCSTLAQDRLALFQTIGMDMALAMFIYQGLFVDDGAIPKWIARLLVVVHLALSPLHLLAGSVYMRWGAEKILANALGFDHARLHDKTLVLMRAPIGEAVSLLGIREVMGRDNPRHFLWLANDEGDMTVQRLGQHELLIEKTLGFANGFESAFRSVKKQPFHVGESVPLAVGEITIMHLNAQQYPDQIKVTFRQSLDSGSLLFYTHRHGRFQPWDISGHGQALHLSSM